MIPVGGIQVPGGIEPIVMGVENPTAGGYAKIATVISADLGKMGQIQPKGPLTFRKVAADEGIAIIKDIWKRLKRREGGARRAHDQSPLPSTSTATAARASATGRWAPTTRSCR